MLISKQRRLSGHDEKVDRDSYHKILSVKNKPDAMVPVYRAIPHVTGGKGRDPVVRGSHHINSGDWVTTQSNMP
jgi:hypothetical protein